MRIRRALLIVPLLALCSVAPVHAAGWVTIGTLPAGAPAQESEQQAAADSSGTVWVAEHDNLNIHATVYDRPAGGTFSLFATVPANGGVQDLAVAPDGTVALVTGGIGQGAACELYVKRPTASAFAAAVPISTGTTCDRPRVTISPSDEILVGYTSDTSGHDVVSIDILQPNGADATQTPAGQVGVATLDALQSTPDGRAVALIDDHPDATHVRLSTSDRGADGAFAAMETIRNRPLDNDEQSARFFDEGLAQDTVGDRIVFWITVVDPTGGGAEIGTITVRARPAGASSYNEFIILQSPTAEANAISGALASNGDALVAWIDRNALPHRVAEAAATKAGNYAFPVNSPSTLLPLDAGTLGLTTLADGSIAGVAGVLGSPVSNVPISEQTGQPAVAGTAFGAGGQVNGLRADGHGNAFAVGNTLVPTAVYAYDATPPVTGAISAPTSVVAGSTASLSLSATDLVSSVASVAWNFGDGQTATGTAPQHAWATPGTYSVSASATDAAGNVAPAPSVSVTVVAPPPLPLLFITPLKDTTRPVISHVKLSHASFAVSSSATAKAARAHHPAPPPKGTSISFGLSESAKVTLTFSRHTAGRKSGHSCKATHLSVTKSKRCTATVIDGTLTRAEKAGTIKVSFSGRIGHTAIALGTHTLTLSAKDPAGNVSRPATAHLTVKRS